MDSVSTNDDLAEDPEPMLGVVPARMNWVRTWEAPGEIVELFLDQVRRDGCLVLRVGDGRDERVGTFQATGDRADRIDWRGSATTRPEDWRDRQHGRVNAYLAATAPPPRR
ncbi:hypothetical protein [Glycomyces albidus]|uniref:Uncharacterized protein n=1 Tax=Glycomyces albidus TaxID=2656774 RepID=A0A6L5GAF6_9ACTN|nr:hypothetical protein [Glycomyces albidus]MQM26645.1 hypothetical protein [Glycomyces albidus]